MKLFNDDCLKVLKQFDEESIDLVVTDCPYHIVSGGCTNDVVKIGRVPKGMLSRIKKEDDAESYLYSKQGKLFKFNEIKFSEWLPEIYRVLKNNTHCYVMVNARNLKELQQCAEDSGFIFQNLLIWDKGNATPNKFYMNACELILMLRKGKAKYINNMGSKNILRVPNIIGNKQHPTEKPAELMQILIENSSNKGDIVLDPFMGVGGGRSCL